MWLTTHPDHDGAFWPTMIDERWGRMKPFTFSLFHELSHLDVTWEFAMAR